MKRFLSGLLCLLLGGGGLWFCATGTFENDLNALPDYDYLEEIRGLEKEGRLGEAEHLADWVLEGSDVPTRAEVENLRKEIHKKRTSFWNRTYRAGKGFIKGDGSSVEELGGAIVSDFLLWGDIRDLAQQGYNKVTGKETDPVIAGLAAVGIATSVASYIPEPGEGAEVSADASFSLLKTLRKTGHLSKKFCGVLVDGCKQSVKGKSLTKGMKEIVVGMKGLFDGVGAARAAAVMKHIDDADALKAAAKLAKASPEPLAILARAHGVKGIDAVRELAKVEDGVESLTKAARKGPKGMQMILDYSKFGARTTKSFRHKHPKEFAIALAKEAGRLPIALASGLFTLFGLFRLKVWKIVGAFRKRRMTPA